MVDIFLKNPGNQKRNSYTTYLLKIAQFSVRGKAKQKRAAICLLPAVGPCDPRLFSVWFPGVPCQRSHSEFALWVYSEQIKTHRTFTDGNCIHKGKVLTWNPVLRCAVNTLTGAVLPLCSHPAPLDVYFPFSGNSAPAPVSLCCTLETLNCSAAPENHSEVDRR